MFKSKKYKKLESRVEGLVRDLILLTRDFKELKETEECRQRNLQNLMQKQVESEKERKSVCHQPTKKHKDGTPRDESKVQTFIDVENYKIENSNRTKYKEALVGKMVIELSFVTNDATPEKYTKFLTELQSMLIEHGYKS